MPALNKAQSIGGFLLEYKYLALSRRYERSITRHVSTRIKSIGMPRSLPQSRVTRIIPSYRGTHPADLAARRLAEVPSHVLQHVELNKLLLDNNKLSGLPEDMKLMTCLEGLFLQFNNIERLPPQLFTISALSVLVLDSNCLTHLPDDVGRLQQLTVLSMESNRLKMLPDGLMECLALQQLNVRNNELTGLPVSVNLLTALQVLDASMNRLAWLPSLAGMTRVTQLQLSYNCLKTLHFSVSSLVSLNLICLEHNMIKHLPAEIFECPKVCCCS
jgi:Leucine-rich repeat (LRR) protein